MNEEILVLAARNVITPSGEWRLIASRAEAFWLEAGMRTLVYALTRKSRLTTLQRTPRIDGMEIRHFVYDGVLSLPYALASMLCAVRSLMITSPPRVIILSGFPTYVFAPWVIRSRAWTVVDVHGPLEEWLDYRPGFIRSNAAVHILLRVAKRLERMAMKKSDAALVVSHPLAEYVCKEYRANRVFVVPCGSSAGVSVNDLESARVKWRKKLGLSRGTVMVYSGGLSQWQLIDKTCLLFRSFKAINFDAQLLLITPNPAQARIAARAAGLRAQDVICTSLDANEIGAALAAGDIGVLLRETNVTNAMAFPNKFTEYVKAGLLIVTSPGLKEPYEIVKRYRLGIGVSPDEVGKPHVLLELSELVRKRASDRRAYYEECLDVFDRYLNLRNVVRPVIGTLACEK